MSESVHKKPKQKMIKKIPRYLLRRIRNLKDYLEWYYQKNSQESVYFYTFPKCASTLFSDYVLKNIVGLRHIDYAAQIYNGKIDNLVFKKTDFVYGPIRIFTIPMSPAYKNLPIPLEYTKLVEPTCHIDFIRNKNAIFLVRDPRDILVSNYYSICYSHGFSPIKEMREFQQQERAEIRSKSVDQYALESASALLNDFETLYKLSQACHKSVVLKYEDMIDKWDYFVEGITQYVEIKPTVIRQIYEKSRPMEKENKMLHRRSGKTGQFRTQFKEATIISLNATFETILERFEYKENVYDA